MNIHQMSFKDPPNCPLYSCIRNSLKTVEGRKNSPSYQSIKPGDIIVLQDKKGDLVCNVTYVNKYHTVEEYLKDETLEKALPCVTTIDDGIKIYEQFVRKKDIEDLNEKHGYGFLGIGIQFIEERVNLNGGMYPLNKQNYISLTKINQIKSAYKTGTCQKKLV